MLPALSKTFSLISSLLNCVVGETGYNCVEQCTPDPFCYDVRDFLTNHGVHRSCANGSAPLNIWGDCADNSTYACYNGYDIPAGMPDTAFPTDSFFFCYTNRSVRVVCVSVRLQQLIINLLITISLKTINWYSLSEYVCGYHLWNIIPCRCLLWYYALLFDSSGIDIPVCEPDLDRCPEVNRIVPVMLGVYILFTQILMFNLLIAMFRFVIKMIFVTFIHIWSCCRKLIFQWTKTPVFSLIWL